MLEYFVCEFNCEFKYFQTEKGEETDEKEEEEEEEGAHQPNQWTTDRGGPRGLSRLARPT